jgi:NADPH2:quinone reductase
MRPEEDFMQAIRIHAFGGPDVMTLEDVPLPVPPENQVRVQIEAAGVNFTDVYNRTGQYSIQLPAILGSEAAGVVEMVGPGVSDLRPGERVAYVGEPGAYAQYAVVPTWRVVKLPDALDTRTAAAVMLQGLTAHYLSHSTYPLQPGQTALVHAAAGGVGQLLVQMAKRRGARVIGTVSTEDKAQLARSLGADEVILYTRDDFEAETRRLTGGRGVDVVYDSVGKTTFEKGLGCVRTRGYMVLFGQSSGAVPPLDPQVLNARGSLFLTRPTLAHYIATRDELVQRSGDLFRWIAIGELHVRIDRTFPLAGAAEAHRYLESRQTHGKVLLLP